MCLFLPTCLPTLTTGVLRGRNRSRPIKVVLGSLIPTVHHVLPVDSLAEDTQTTVPLCWSLLTFRAVYLPSTAGPKWFLNN